MAGAVRALILLSSCVFAVPCLSAAERELFPSTLHLTRQVEDSISNRTTVIEEYYGGNRALSISGSRTVIADYEKQELLEIDRGAGTYSVTRFGDLAAALHDIAPVSPRTQVAAAAMIAPRWLATADRSPQGARPGAEQYLFSEEGETARRVSVGVDRGVALSRDAVEVIIGAAYPNPMRDEHEPLLQAARKAGPLAGANAVASASVEENVYGLPVLQSFTYTDSGVEVTFRSTITRIGAEAAPADALLIPTGSRRVEARAVTLRRELRELDQPSQSTQQP